MTYLERSILNLYLKHQLINIFMTFMITSLKKKLMRQQNPKRCLLTLTIQNRIDIKHCNGYLILTINTNYSSKHYLWLFGFLIHAINKVSL